MGVTASSVVGNFFSPRFFQINVRALEGRGLNIRTANSQLLEVFEAALARGNFWSFLIGTLAAAVLSYWLAKRIVRPLTQAVRRNSRWYYRRYSPNIFALDSGNQAFTAIGQ